MSSIRDSLRQLRDLAFAVAGPRNYESVSTLGFVVQSDATQSLSSGSLPAEPTPEPDVVERRPLDVVFGFWNNNAEGSSGLDAPSGSPDPISFDEFRALALADSVGGLPETNESDIAAAWAAGASA